MKILLSAVLFHLRLLAAALIVTAASRAQGYYAFHPLGDPGDISSNYSYAGVLGINNFGVMGGYLTGRSSIAARFNGLLVETYASPFGSPSVRAPSSASAINDAGDIAGWWGVSWDLVHAYYVTANGQRRDLHPAFAAGGHDSSVIVKINNRGDLIGHIRRVWDFAYSYVGDATGAAFSLADLLGESFAATDLNNNGVIVGNDALSGVIYNRNTGNVTYFDTDLGLNGGQAHAVNDAGEVAGIYGTTGVLYTGGRVVLFGAGQVGKINDINNDGTVVGETTVAAGSRPFIYAKNSGAIYNPNDLLPFGTARTWTIMTVTGINDSGMFCGVARRAIRPGDVVYDDYVYRSYKMYYVPEIIRFGG